MKKLLFLIAASFVFIGCTEEGIVKNFNCGDKAPYFSNKTHLCYEKMADRDLAEQQFDEANGIEPGSDTDQTGKDPKDSETDENKTGEGSGEGTDEGSGEGSGEGTGEGSTDEGTGEGSGEGSGEGTGEGSTDEGTGEGTDEGSGEGTGEGTDEGSGEGSGEGTGEGTGEGEGGETPTV